MNLKHLTTLAACGAAALTAPAEAKISVHYKGENLSFWIIIDLSAASNNYDAITHAGSIPFTQDGPFAAMDVMVTGLPGLDGLPVSLSGSDFDAVMGEYEVIGGLGTTTCDFRPIGIWVTGPAWGVHVIFFNTPTALTLDGFGPDGGIYSAQGLSIPVQVDVHRPDGSVVVLSDSITEIEFISPLDLSPPCPADCDGNGSLNIDDLDCFISAFLGQCS